MKFEKTKVYNFEGALRGMRNPMNSWDKADSFLEPTVTGKGFVIGENDLALAQRLIRAGSEHRKFMRQISVCVDITAPMYWWSEFDTYKIGTVENSTSKMHKLASTPIALSCFETDDYDKDLCVDPDITIPTELDRISTFTEDIVEVLENIRQSYLKTKDKRYWKELIRWLPESWLQTRTVTMNYENLFSMCRQRRNHKLNEWSGLDMPENENFIKWARTLPYAQELIFVDELSTKE